MSGFLKILRAGPLATIQDMGRIGNLRYGIAASGPMVRSAFRAAGAMLERAGDAGIEFTPTGIEFSVDTTTSAGFCGGDFKLTVNGEPAPWNAAYALAPGDRISIAPGNWGNYGYVRFEHELDVPPLLGSRSTNSTVGLGGFDGRPLLAGDRIPFGAPGNSAPLQGDVPNEPQSLPIRVIWGLHADLFPTAMRRAFLEATFRVSKRLDRMGVRLDGGDFFREARILSLVSDAVVPGDIQVLGDGTPIVLMRDHQPTGGYPRIATVISADMDRFAQLRPGTPVKFEPVTLAHALAAEGGNR
ncbi:5-oxoprolinase subunit C family protein [Paradevosia shaoguanensis]|uniref:Biotin-dependent carboxyltransferase family protein n=1 Tax=Paradevosia shaoguanensis TaxID=1335043 RepID=A0AA41QLF3_9HYPH|nr:biotin-dependent carboxyltransferase family protein [Paradevosia shaoguanensis]MCI0127042.1 biotin-dependent carboxyltransferase family protein [Paradevosia shaoguanensis]